MRKIDLKNKKDQIKVAVIGEYYTIMEPFVNHYIEDFFCHRATSVDRWVNFTNTLIIRPIDEMQVTIKEYTKYDMGATGTSP